MPDVLCTIGAYEFEWCAKKYETNYKEHRVCFHCTAQFWADAEEKGYRVRTCPSKTNDTRDEERTQVFISGVSEQLSGSGEFELESVGASRRRAYAGER